MLIIDHFASRHFSPFFDVCPPLMPLMPFVFRYYFVVSFFAMRQLAAACC